MNESSGHKDLSISEQVERSVRETRNQQILSHIWLIATIATCGIGAFTLYLNAH